MRGRTAIILAAILMAITLVPVLQADAEAGTDVLIDGGNGETSWATGSGGTVLETVEDAAASLGMEVELDGELTVDGVSTVTTGSESTGGSLSQTGTTGVTVTAEWTLYGWDGSEWVEAQPTDPSSDYGALALGLYPEGVAPVETPEHPDSWTMFRGDSANSGSQEATFSSTQDYEVDWYERGAPFANPLYAGGNIIQKFSTYTTGEHRGYASVSSIDPATGEHAWDFWFLSGMNYESSTPLIVGDYVYVGTMTGYLYKIPLAEGPGEDNANVTSIGGASFADAEPAPSFIRDFEEGTTQDAGFSSLVCYAGAIYATHSNGMVYCFDLDLNLIWSFQMDGGAYFIAPTVVDGLVYTSAFNGHLYILGSADGSVRVDETIYQVEIRDRMYGGLGQIAVFNTGSTYTLIFTVTDGLGMSQTHSGLAVYEYDPNADVVVQRFMDTDMGSFGRYVSPVEIDGFTGAYVVVSEGTESALIRISTDGIVERVTEGLAEIHSAGVVVNNEWIYLTSYASSDPIYRISLIDGSIDGVAYCAPEVRNFNMASPLVLGDVFIGCTDSGMFVLDGAFPAYVVEENVQGAPVILYLSAIAAAIIIILAAVWAGIRYGKGVEKPFRYLKERALHYLYGENLSHNTRNRHRLKFVLAVGAILIVVSFTLCICIGSTSILNPVEAYSALFSAIAKGGVGLDTVETTVFVSRLPRTIAALAVGIGLAVAGSIYQAIIRNPLVDPYIMGVSSGAGVAAIAVIAFDFTFFGLFSSHSIFLTAIAAVIGGLVAFGCTMIIAEKAGGSSINYVLAGVVVGLAFSAVQTLMLTMAGQRLSNALSWLYGSFAEVTWSQVAVVLALSLFLSLVPMIWAKEFNLVLLGEDQAREMGLNVRQFNRWMLILASVLTSVCVAFCGVIGFVGLVIPHLCRMLLGSDHRMVLPASLCFGAVMLMLADLLSRTGYYGLELPVGAITTIIGIPVFAYLLIKKGRIYDG